MNKNNEKPFPGESNFVYVCYGKDCWESIMISIHQTKVGAWRSGNKWLQEKFMEFHESRSVIGRMSGDFLTRELSFSVCKVSVLT